MSTRGLLDGFQSGWGMMNQHNQQEENKRRYELGRTDRQTAIDLEADKYATNQERLDVQQGQRDAEHTMNIANAGLEFNANQFKAEHREEVFQQNKKVADSRLAANNSTTNFNNTKNKITKEQYKLAKNQKTLAAALVKAEHDPTAVPTTLNHKDMDGTDPALMREQGMRDTAKALHVAVGKGAATGNFTAAISPANKLFKKSLNRAAGGVAANGGKIKDVEIINFEPLRESVPVPMRQDGETKNIRVRLKVTNDKGESYEAYLSELRSSDPNDKEKMLSAESMFQKVTAMNGLAHLYEAGGINKQETQNARSYLGGLTDSNVKVPAQTQNIRNKAKAMGIPEGMAWELDGYAKRNPQKLALARVDFIKQYTSDAGYHRKSPEQQLILRKQAEQLFDRSFAPPQTQPAPTKQPVPEQVQQAPVSPNDPLGWNV